jgi:eukaryotic-like serine/threonine-protein kinase
MPGKVHIEVLSGELSGQTWEFTEHDAFVFGRSDDCDAIMPKSDTQVSRHHFMIEVVPPTAHVRDLGSLNKTYVNEIDHGGRKPGETPQEGAQRSYPEVKLKNNDRVRAGQTEFLICMDDPAFCFHCVKEIGSHLRDQYTWIGNTYLCDDCRPKVLASGMKPEPVRCKECQKDVSDEISSACRGDYICDMCRKNARAEANDLLRNLFEEAVSQNDHPQVPGLCIEERIGEGAFGAVYRAVDNNNQSVAVKVMLSEVAVDPKSRERFLREIEICRQLDHPNIVPVFDFGSNGSLFYFVMELCDSGNLQEWYDQQHGPLPLDDLRPIMLQSLNGVAFAHNKEIVHRDIKPSNILFSRRGDEKIIKIADFGLAKNFERAGFSGPTKTKEFAGTFPFMPPEQITDFKYTKPVSDVWSLTATFYYLLTGCYPRNFPSDQDPVRVVLDKDGIVALRDRDSSFPRQFAQVIDRALSHNHKERYQTAGELRTALSEVF